MKQQFIRSLTPSMRWLLLIGSLLAFIAGLQLFVLSEQTSSFFAWTIDVPLTAAFLGAIYWAGSVLVLLGWSQPCWIRARIAIPGVVFFAFFTLLTTLMHLNLFHLSSRNPLTVIATWAWLTVYLLLPVVGTGILIRQWRAPGSDPVREAPLPFGVRCLLGVQAASMLLVGTALFFLPDASRSLWPWPLTTLTAQAVASWLLGLGLTAAQTVAENDWKRIWIGMVSYGVLAVLQGIALVRYSATVDWTRINAWLYLLFLLSILFLSLYSLVSARRAFQREHETHETVSSARK